MHRYRFVFWQIYSRWLDPPKSSRFSANSKMPLNKRIKILVRNKEIRTFLQRLQRTVHGSGCDALYRFFIEQTLKLAYIVTGEQLFLKVPYLEILREVFFLIRRPAAVEGIGVHKGVYRKKREMERAARLRDPGIASSIARFTSSGANR